jgi:DNA-binding FadR family transcriptional regulator
MREKGAGKRRKTLAENTADRLVDMIIDGQFDKNERLPSEFELAALLDVGRGTIREAIKILASRHVVEIRRGHGTYIADKPGQIDDPLGLAFVDNKKKLALDLFELRLIIEPRIAALAARRVNKKEIEEIERACSAVEISINKGISYADEDIRLHELIAKATKNQVVENIIPIIHSAVELFVELRDEELMRSTVASHRAIVDAIKEKNPQKAESEMKLHLEKNKIAIDRFVKGV